VSLRPLLLSFETCVAPARVYTLTVTSPPFAKRRERWKRY
jgi:hypothetical protein